MRSTHRVRSKQELAALGSPLRQEIALALQALQPCTVKELGRHLGRLPVSLYYHLRKLREAGLVLAQDAGGETRYRLRAARLRIDPDRGDPEDVATLRKLGAGAFRRAARLHDACVGDPPARDRARRKHTLAQRTLRLDRPGLERVNAKLRELLELIDEAQIEGEGELFTLTVHLAPNRAHRDPASD